MSSWVFPVIEVAFIALIVFLCIGIAKRKGVVDYDERQRAARGQAFAAAYFTLLGFGAASELLKTTSGLRWADSSATFIIGMCLSLVVFCLICIFKDAYTSPRINPVRNIIALLLIGVSNVFLGLVQQFKHPLTCTDGVLEGLSINLCLGACMFICVIAMIIRYAVRSREEKVEE